MPVVEYSTRAKQLQPISGMVIRSRCRTISISDSYTYTIGISDSYSVVHCAMCSVYAVSPLIWWWCAHDYRQYACETYMIHAYGNTLYQYSAITICAVILTIHHT